MVVQQFNIISEGLATVAEVDELLVQLLDNPNWKELETRTSRRLCDQYTFDGQRKTNPPPHLRFVNSIVQRLLDREQANRGNGEVVPLSCFLCLYEDGDDSCPNHTHDCRQLTLSLGDERTLNVEGKSYRMKHGDVITLDGERHGVPMLRQAPCQPRVSLNLFFTTVLDQATREVSVNHRPGSGYAAGSSHGKAKGRGQDARNHWQANTNTCGEGGSTATGQNLVSHDENPRQSKRRWGGQRSQQG